jgi:ubiquitin-like protein ATG12
MTLPSQSASSQPQSQSQSQHQHSRSHTPNISAQPSSPYDAHSTTTTPTPTIAGETRPATVPDEDPLVDLPMTMTASVMLTNLPRDASQALGEVEALDAGKGMF